MSNQNLDMIMVLMGENSRTRGRSRKAIQTYREYGRIPILLSGSHSGVYGLVLRNGEEPACIRARRYFLEKNVRDEDIVIQAKSVDTVGDFYYSQELGLTGKGIGLVTDSWHMQRSLWLARKFCGDDSKFHPIPSEDSPDIFRGLQEIALKIALYFDMVNIPDGNFELLKKYMESKHPFHSAACGNKPEPSFYGSIMWMAAHSGMNLR